MDDAEELRELAERLTQQVREISAQRDRMILEYDKLRDILTRFVVAWSDVVRVLQKPGSEL